MILNITPPKLTGYQRAILDSPARYTITEACTKAGKTFSHIWWLFKKAHEPQVRAGSNFFWVAPVYSQSKIAFDRLRRKVVASGAYQINRSALTITCPNGAVIRFKSADDPDNLYGEDVYAIVFDEAARAKEEAFHALRSTVTATEAPIKMIGNFGGTANWMHRLKEKAKSDPNYAYFKVTAYDAIDAGILQAEEVAQAKKDLPDKIFRELYMAEAAEDKSQLISNESILKMQTTKQDLELDKDGIPVGVKYITADIARLGKDKTVIFVWADLNVIDSAELESSTIPESVDAIKLLQLKYNVNASRILVDEDGVGGGVKDVLGCSGFVNNSRPVKISGKAENFASLKDQCYYKLAESINRNEIRVDLPVKVFKHLQQELEMVRLPSGVDLQKIKMLSKDKIKQLLGRSPDYSDTLMMRMKFNLKPNTGEYFF